MVQNPINTYPLVPIYSPIVHGPLRGLHKIIQALEIPTENSKLCTDRPLWGLNKTLKSCPKSYTFLIFVMQGIYKRIITYMNIQSISTFLNASNKSVSFSRSMSCDIHCSSSGMDSSSICIFHAILEVTSLDTSWKYTNINIIYYFTYVCRNLEKSWLSREL